MKVKTLGIIFSTCFLFTVLPGFLFLFSANNQAELIISTQVGAVYTPLEDLNPEIIQEDPFPIYSLEPFNEIEYNSTSVLSRYHNYDSFGVGCYPFYNNLTDNEYYDFSNYKNYGNCQMDEPSHIEIIENKLVVNCKYNKINFFYLDPGKTEVFGSYDLEVKWIKFDRSIEIDTKKRQFLFVRCASKEAYTFVFNKFNATVSELAQNQRKMIENHYGLNSSRTLSVYFLVFDSLSRQNFFRSFPQTEKFLHENIVSGKFSSNFSVFDFPLSNTINIYTKANMIPVLYGKSHKDLESELEIMNPNNETSSDSFIKLQKKYSLWSDLSKLGYVTMFSFDTTYDFLSKNTGKFLTTDIQFLNFWNAGKKVFGYNDFSNNKRCFGKKDAHWFGLNYTSQFLQNYQNHNRFAYLHLSPGHESSGVIKTADKDIKAHLNSLLEFYSNNDEDLLLLFMSDHGRGQGRLEFSLDHFVEHRVPLTLLICNKKLLAKINSDKFLEFNTKRLVSRFDLHLTVKTLALTPYGKISEEDYEELKKRYPIKGVKSLAREKITEKRGCLDVGAREIDCICKDYESVKMSEDVERIALKRFEEMLMAVIRKVRTRRKNLGNTQELEMIKSEVFRIKDKDSGDSRRYRMVFEEKGGGRNFLVEGVFATVDRFVETRARIEDINGIQSHEIFEVSGVEYQIQIVNIRTDDKNDLIE